jgi:hypothetical protein
MTVVSLTHRYHLSVADATDRWTHDRLERYRFPCRRGGSCQPYTVSARRVWEDRMRAETVLSMLTVVCHCKKIMSRAGAYVQVRLAFTMAAINVLVQRHGFSPPRRASCPSRWLHCVCTILIASLVCQRRPPFVHSTCICFASVHDVCSRVHSVHRRWYFPWEVFIIEGLKHSSHQGCDAWLPGRRRT